jgi:hypothetical protein
LESKTDLSEGVFELVFCLHVWFYHRDPRWGVGSVPASRIQKPVLLLLQLAGIGGWGGRNPKLAHATPQPEQVPRKTEPCDPLSQRLKNAIKCGLSPFPEMAPLTGRQTHVSLLVLPITVCDWGASPYLSVPQFPHLKVSLKMTDATEASQEIRWISTEHPVPVPAEKPVITDHHYHRQWSSAALP